LADDSQAAHAAGARNVGYAAAAASAGHLPVAGADAVIFRMAGLAFRLPARAGDPPARS